MPSVHLDADVHVAAANEALVQQLERVVADWTATIAQVTQREAEKKSGKGGPMVEVDFWRDRCMVRLSLTNICLAR